jgi:hypothetical protein
MAMTQQEATDKLNKANETMVKVGNETDKLINLAKELKQQLDAAGGAGGTITPELETTINSLITRIEAVDALVPDSPGPEK